MSSQPVIPVRGAGKPSADALAQMDQRWRVRHLMLAPHRLGFFLAMVVVLVAAGRWPVGRNHGRLGAAAGPLVRLPAR